ncbi:hypothetical protein RJ640_020607 [Escallonia rubra]|uniref:F-box domain-containing protein n=1 Tax=Escallonia rubra TaxID=112253 RepID=A0AA88RR58_9ASTE|nr:hypothetical protein RJ640_020607 [Escallonia rubra]
MSPSTNTPPHDVVKEGGAIAFSAVLPDILESHILTRLDGPTLASASCASSTLHSLSDQDHLWSTICHSTWPSTRAPRLRRLVCTFPGAGPRSFFANAFPLSTPDPTTVTTPAASTLSPPTQEIISAVDIHYKDKLIFTKVQETETATGWFRCSPFRIDLLDPKDVIPTPAQHPNGDDTCTALNEDLTLSWILIDPQCKQAMNLSSYKPVSVQRHWLSGEVQVRFGSILAGGTKACTKGLVQFGIVVTCGGSEGGEMQVKEVSLVVEDMDGMHLNGGESLVILQRALEGQRGKGGDRVEEGRRRYGRYLEMKKERKERKRRAEGRLDMICVVLGVSLFAALLFFVCSR